MVTKQHSLRETNTNYFEDLRLPDMQDAANLAKNEIRKNVGQTYLKLSSTAQYPTHGSDTLTIGDQNVWGYSNQIFGYFENNNSSSSEQSFDWLKHVLETSERQLVLQSRNKYDELAQLIKRKFAVIEEIQLIFLEQKQDTLGFVFFLNNEHFDRGLMNRLFDLELDILDLNPDATLTFNYLPMVMGADPQKFLSLSASCIFTRD